MNHNNWIFLRGLTRGNIHWAEFPQIFKLQKPEVVMELLEIPGNGETHNIETPLKPEEVLNFLRNKSKFVQQNQKFNICGISLGGMLALKWTELHPNDIDSVSIINSSLGQYSSFYHRLNIFNIGKVLSALFEADPEKQEETILNMTSNKLKENKKYIKAFAEYSSQYPVSKKNFFRQLALANEIVIHDLPEVPLKVICSLQDHLVDPVCSLQIQSMLGGSLIEHPTAGHDLPLDEPEWLSKVLLSQV